MSAWETGPVRGPTEFGTCSSRSRRARSAAAPCRVPLAADSARI
jgi:hypothetical protein